jgi:hypothetical protein
MPQHASPIDRFRWCLAALLAAAALAACNGDDAADEPAEVPEDTDAVPQEPPSAEEPAEPEVTDDDGTEVDGFEATFTPGDCFGLDAPQVECGYVTVPLHHDDPQGDAIELAAAVLPAADPDTTLAPVLVLAGGPGQAFLAQALTQPDVAEVFAVGPEVVVFDQRGAGLSRPSLTCPEAREEADGILDVDVDAAVGALGGPWWRRSSADASAPTRPRATGGSSATVRSPSWRPTPSRWRGASRDRAERGMWAATGRHQQTAVAPRSRPGNLVPSLEGGAEGSRHAEAHRHRLVAAAALDRGLAFRLEHPRGMVARVLQITGLSAELGLE